jgi:hypothetical protein
LRDRKVIHVGPFIRMNQTGILFKRQYSASLSLHVNEPSIDTVDVIVDYRNTFPVLMCGDDFVVTAFLY